MEILVCGQFCVGNSTALCVMTLSLVQLDNWQQFDATCHMRGHVMKSFIPRAALPATVENHPEVPPRRYSKCVNGYTPAHLLGRRGQKKAVRLGGKRRQGRCVQY